MSWSDSRVDQLRLLWGQGSTARQIADSIGGVSRNAVIGKAHRLGLQPRPSPVRNSGEVSKARAAPLSVEDARSVVAAPPPGMPVVPVAAAPPRVAKAPKVERIPASAATGLPKGHIAPAGPPAPPRRNVPAKPSAEIRGKTGLLDLTDKVCRWPIGHPGEPDFYFCGDPVNSGFPYCLSHCAAAYQVPKPRRDVAKLPSYGGARKRR